MECVLDLSRMEAALRNISMEEYATKTHLRCIFVFLDSWATPPPTHLNDSGDLLDVAAAVNLVKQC